MNALLAVCGCVTLVLGAPPELTPQERESRGLLAQAMLDYESIEELGKEGVAGKMRPLMDDTPGDELATPEMKTALAGRIAEQMLARSEDAETFLAFVDASEPRWIPADDDRSWFHIECNDQMTISPTPGDRSDPRGHLVKLAESRYARGGALSAWCADREGSMIVFYEARDEKELHLSGFSLRSEEFNDTHYFGGTSSGIRAWRPPITGQEILERDGVVLCADAMLVMKWDDGTTSAWHTIWSWDANGERWTCAVQGNVGSNHPGILF